ncbi:MAG: T9SS type A sorting domain-containing protein [Cytophagaceae bacterium]|nr:T9SS type A sorting domain-containing protein [Cytophagaceae bacterium]
MVKAFQSILSVFLLVYASAASDAGYTSVFNAKSPAGIYGTSDFNTVKIFPNPFNNTCKIEYELKESAQVRIELYDLLGVKVLEIENAFQSPGNFSYPINITQKGIFILQLKIKDQLRSYKLVNN